MGELAKYGIHSVYFGYYFNTTALQELQFSPNKSKVKLSGQNLNKKSCIY